MTTQHEKVFTSEHVSPAVYYVVFLALMVGLAVTVAVAFVHLGVLNTPVALLIATIKASLVLWYFMHLREMPKIVLIMFGSCFFMLLIGAILIFCDYFTRWAT